MCREVDNYGFGQLLNDTSGTLVPAGVWYGSDQFMLELIFHHRMMRYDCLTDNPAEAAAIYVPYYAALDIGRNLWNQTTKVRDALMNEMLHLLRSSPEWAAQGGHDHIIVVGRTTWDMRRKTAEDSDWGSKLMLVPEIKNMTVLTVEARIAESTTTHRNELGIPFPTYFHPSKMSDIIIWQEKNSVFCLQPRGDSFTRRSTFDSMLAGCIPVLFHHDSAHEQYKWHLPSDYTKYSVYIPEDAVKKGTVKIDDVLLSYSPDQIEGMRNDIINMIPKFVYTDPSYYVNGMRDAFDIAVESVIERMRSIRDDWD